MTKLRKFILVGLTSASLGLAVSAVSASPGACHHKDFDQEKFSEHMQQRQARLHEQLKLSTAQEPAWKAFTEKVKFTPGERPNREELAGLKAPERMERMAAMRKQREGRMAERVAAVKEFYATLTPGQQKTFDDNFMSHGKHAKQQS